MIRYGKNLEELEFNPASTHIVATIEDLSDVLAYAYDDDSYMDEDVNEMSDTTSPPATLTQGSGQLPPPTTSTWWLHGGSNGKPPKRRCRDSRNGDTDNARQAKTRPEMVTLPITMPLKIVFITRTLATMPALATTTMTMV